MPYTWVDKIYHRERVDGILFWSLENIRYLCGFTGSDGVLVITPQERIFLSDSRYEEQARGEVREANFVRYKQKILGVAQVVKALRLRRVGFESNAMAYESYRRLREKLPRVTFIPLADELGRIRARKSPEETEKIRRAIHIASLSFGDTLPRLKPGARERTIAEFLECRLKRRGGEKVAFDTIVASGPRGALPHGAATEKRMRNGEAVVLDFGVRYQGYHSDETKTLILGKVQGEQRKIYETVRRAQDKALKKIRPGVSVRRIDAAARETIAQAGYGKYFGHGTGHGVGLAVHEEPSISPRGRGVVEEGMVFTVEPGIYIPGWGGVRLEDMVQVNRQGYEVLTILSKNLKDNIL
jgi:Xaa-Pro aminopeptidase